MQGAGSEATLAALLARLVEERQRVEQLLQQVQDVLRSASPPAKAVRATNGEIAPPRVSPLDQVKGVMTATADLRVAEGNLSAERVAKLFGVSLSQLAAWLGRSRQAMSKTPDADSLQPALSYFERVARLRLMTGSDAEFRKWLRMPHPEIAGKNPLGLLAAGQW